LSLILLLLLLPLCFVVVNVVPRKAIARLFAVKDGLEYMCSTYPIFTAGCLVQDNRSRESKEREGERERETDREEGGWSMRASKR